MPVVNTLQALTNATTVKIKIISNFLYSALYPLWLYERVVVILVAFKLCVNSAIILSALCSVINCNMPLVLGSQLPIVFYFPSQVRALRVRSREASPRSSLEWI